MTLGFADCTDTGKSIPGVGRPEEGEARRGRECIQIQTCWAGMLVRVRFLRL